MEEFAIPLRNSGCSVADAHNGQLRVDTSSKVVTGNSQPIAEFTDPKCPPVWGHAYDV
jgi:hypothetical protein